MRRSRALAFLVALGPMVGCGDTSATDQPGSGTDAGGNVITPSSPNTPNVVDATVDSGPAGAQYVNGIFVDVNVCVPQTSNCQTIDHVLVDTGSVGLRLLSAGQAGGKLSLALQPATDSNGKELAECNQFLDGFTWGPVKLADVRLGGEIAANAPIQVIDESTYSVPHACSSPTSGVGVNEDTIEVLGAKGILGIGMFLQDCGAVCAPGSGSYNPGLYYACSSSTGTCQAADVALSSQVQNPVALFATDNNGTIIELPVVPSAGATSAAGSLVFGIGTQANNSVDNATVAGTDACGNITTSFSNVAYPNGYVDSGSNTIGYLTDALLSGLGIHTCTTYATDFYCTDKSTTAPVRQNARIKVAASQNGLVNFDVADANALMNTPNYVFDDLGSSNSTSYSCSTGKTGGPAFAWGLPFFFGRNVFTAIEGRSTPAGTGPFLAYE